MPNFSTIVSPLKEPQYCSTSLILLTAHL